MDVIVYFLLWLLYAVIKIYLLLCICIGVFFVCWRYIHWDTLQPPVESWRIPLTLCCEHSLYFAYTRPRLTSCFLRYHMETSSFCRAAIQKWHVGLPFLPRLQSAALWSCWVGLPSFSTGRALCSFISSGLFCTRLPAAQWLTWGRFTRTNTVLKAYHH